MVQHIQPNTWKQRRRLKKKCQLRPPSHTFFAHSQSFIYWTAVCSLGPFFGPAMGAGPGGSCTPWPPGSCGRGISGGGGQGGRSIIIIHSRW
jgi:hypothetical protein